MLLVPNAGEVGDGEVKRFVHQLAVLLREAANRSFELRESFRCPRSCHWLYSWLPIGL
jgi:hypothetical protein